MGTAAGRGGKFLQVSFENLLARIDGQADAEGEQWTSSEFVAGQFHEIFLGADDDFRSVRFGFGGNRRQIMFAVLMVVGKLSPADELRVEGLQGPAKAGGVSDSAESHHRLPGERGWRLHATVDVAQLVGCGGDLDQGSPVGESGQALFEKLAAFAGNQVSSAEYHEVGAGECNGRLAKQSPGEQMVAAERVESVDDDDVEITLKSAMLKSIIQEQQLAVVFSDGLACGLDTIGTLHVRDFRKLLSELSGFVVGARGGPVTTTDDGRADLAVAVPVGDPCGQWRLARATQGEIADTDHRNPDVEDFRPTTVITAVADRHAQAISLRNGPQQTPSDGRTETPRATAGQISVSTGPNHVCTHIRAREAGCL